MTDDAENGEGIAVAHVEMDRVGYRQKAAAIEDRFRGLLECAPDAMAVVSVDGRILVVNAQTERLFGYSSEDLVGQPSEILMPARFRARHSEHRAGFAARPGVRAMGDGMEMFGLRKDGSEFPIEVGLSPLHTDDGIVVVSAMRDITERRRTEAALRESEERYRTVVETATDGILTVDESGSILFANRAAEKIFGFPAAELIGQPLSELIPRKLRGTYTSALRRYLSTGARGLSLSAFEFTGLHRNGTEVPLEVSLGDTVRGGRHVFTGIVRDMTDRNVSESIRSALYRIVETTSGPGDVSKFYAAIHRTVNKLMDARNLYIVLKDQRTGRPTFPYYVDQVHSVPPPVTPGSLTDHVLKSGEPLLSTPETFERLVGEGKAAPAGRQSLYWLGAPLKEGDRTFGALIVQSYSEKVRFREAEREVLSFVARHIAATLERKRAEDEVAEWKRRFEAAVLASGQVLYDWDTRADEVSYGGCFESLLGFTADELYGGVGRWLELVHPSDAKIFGTEKERALLTREPFRLEYRMRRKDGKTVYVRDEGYFVGGKDAFSARMVGFVADVTERKILEEQLRQSRKMEAIGRLAGGIAHDFNNVLTVILGFSDILMRQIPDENLRQNVEEISKAGERAASLTGQLLAFSRKQMLAPRIVDINGLVVNLERMLHRVLGEDIEVATFLAPGIVNVKADPGQLEHVVMNLSINARDAMPGGGLLSIHTANVELDDTAVSELGLGPGTHVMLAVSDTGTGMDEETRLHLFEPFFTTKELGKGTGLGLATCYGIVKQSGGAIRVESSPGNGTTFRVYLPRVEGEAESNAEAARVGPVRGAETILLVEDEVAVRSLARHALEEGGFRVIEAEDGQEALELAAKHVGPLDLLLTDVVMPRLSGRVLADRLLAERPGLKVLYVSGYTDSAVISRGVKGKAFLQKPFRSDKLLRKVREILDG